MQGSNEPDSHRLGVLRSMALSRSEQMSRIRGKDTTPEIKLRKALWSQGLRYRLHRDTPVGRPDLVFVGPEVAVFIDGCFWHGCPKDYVFPRSRRDFWTDKLTDNLERDRRQTLGLEDRGWTVLRIWEHEIDEKLEDTVDLVEGVVREGGEGRAPIWRVEAVEPLDDDSDIERLHLVTLRDPETTRVVECPHGAGIDIGPA